MKVIELLRFKLADAVSDEQFVNESRVVEAELLARHSGIISIEMAHSANGEWLLIIQWESLYYANASLCFSDSWMAAKKLLFLIDLNSIDLARYSVKK